MGREMNKNYFYFHLIINSFMLIQHLYVYTVWSVAEPSEVCTATSFRVKMSSAFTHHQQHCPCSVNTQELD